MILNGLADAYAQQTPAYFEALKKQYNVKDMDSNYELERAGVIGTKCK